MATQQLQEFVTQVVAGMSALQESIQTLQENMLEIADRLKRVEVRTKVLKTITPLAIQISRLKESQSEPAPQAPSETASEAPSEPDSVAEPEGGDLESEAPSEDPSEMDTEDRYRYKPYRCTRCGKNYVSPHTLRIHQASACRGNVKGNGLVLGNGLVSGRGLVRGGSIPPSRFVRPQKLGHV